MTPLSGVCDQKSWFKKKMNLDLQPSASEMYEKKNLDNVSSWLDSSLKIPAISRRNRKNLMTVREVQETFMEDNSFLEGPEIQFEGKEIQASGEREEKELQVSLGRELAKPDPECSALGVQTSRPFLLAILDDLSRKSSLAYYLFAFLLCISLTLLVLGWALKTPPPVEPPPLPPPRFWKRIVRSVVWFFRVQTHCSKHV